MDEKQPRERSRTRLIDQIRKDIEMREKLGRKRKQEVGQLEISL